MGLDMYLYRVSRVPKDELKKLEGKNYYDITEELGSCVMINEGDYNAELPMYKDVIPYLSPIMVKNEYIDLLKLKADYNVDPEAFIVGESYSSESVSYSFMVEGQKNSVKVTLTPDELRDKYRFEKVERMYIAYATEVHYWRKAYEVQDIFHKNIDDIENCGYYKVSEELLKEVAKEDDTVFSVPFVDTDEVGTFYHSWY